MNNDCGGEVGEKGSVRGLWVWPNRSYDKFKHLLLLFSCNQCCCCTIYYKHFAVLLVFCMRGRPEAEAEAEAGHKRLMVACNAFLLNLQH